MLMMLVWVVVVGLRWSLKVVVGGGFLHVLSSGQELSLLIDQQGLVLQIIPNEDSIQPSTLHKGLLIESTKPY